MTQVFKNDSQSSQPIAIPSNNSSSPSLSTNQRKTMNAPLHNHSFDTFPSNFPYSFDKEALNSRNPRSFGEQQLGGNYFDQQPSQSQDTVNLPQSSIFANPTGSTPKSLSHSNELYPTENVSFKQSQQSFRSYSNVMEQSVSSAINIQINPEDSNSLSTLHSTSSSLSGEGSLSSSPISDTLMESEKSEKKKHKLSKIKYSFQEFYSSVANQNVKLKKNFSSSFFLN